MSGVGRYQVPTAGRSYARLVSVHPEPLLPSFGALPEGAVDRVLRQLAVWSLDGSGHVDPLADASSESVLVDEAVAHGLLGSLVGGIGAAVIDLSPEQIERSRTLHDGAAVWCLRVERRMLEIEDRFDAGGGIEHRILKGPAVAHLDEHDPALRTFADLDLLLAAHDLDRGIRLLTEMGIERRIAERRPGFDRRFVKGVGMSGADLIEVDVHRNLCGGPHGFRVPPGRLLEERELFEVGGRELPALSARHRLLHACYHAMVGSSSPPLRTLRDLAGYLRRPDLGPEAVLPEARRWRGEAVVAAAVIECIAVMGIDVPAWQSWAEGFDIDPEELQIMADGRIEGEHLVDWTEVRELSWSDRPAFLFAVAFPSRAVLAERGETTTDRLRSGVRHAARQLALRLDPRQLSG